MKKLEIEKVSNGYILTVGSEKEVFQDFERLVNAIAIDFGEMSIGNRIELEFKDE